MGRRICVGNLPFSTNEAELRELFGRTGAVQSVKVVRNAATGRSRGFAFVEMATGDETQQAIHEIHQQEVGGRCLTVNESSRPWGLRDQRW